MSRRYGYHGSSASRSSERRASAPFEMTRRDRDGRGGSRGSSMSRRDDYDDDLVGSMRDAYSYLHAGRDSARDNGSSRREGPFGDTRDLLGLVAGGALVGLTAGLLGNANIGNTGIPMALIPAGIGYAASYFDVLPSWSKDFRNAATGALVVGTGLWALAQGVRVQASRQQPGGGVAIAGSPPPAQIGQAPSPFAAPFVPQPQPAYAAPCAPPPPYVPPPLGAPSPFAGGMRAPGAMSPSRSPLSEAEMISIANKYGSLF
jgi:hypothetical protein